MALKDRREELIAAALRVMVRDGVAKATTRAIVSEAGMTLGVFHYCFDSREQLLQEVITRTTDSLVAETRRAFAGEDDLSSIIVKSLSTFWAGVEANPGEHQLSYELSQHALRQMGHEALALQQYRHYLEVHEELLRETADRAGIQWTVPVPVLARYLNSVLDGVTMTWLIDRDSKHSREVLRLTGEHLMTLAAKPPSTED
ncbi:TetR/AcrR family transcriptional regulator [Amycolatopsis sp. NPDC021455]|uniref:TetR/AcrR family transcriptional regulator n=1 Tax=Amycolatopsis sp. NPDC021455 TaxID=3154901 RepID=UPI0033CD350D